MGKKLVIVESPAKAKTIKKFLGKDYEVESSYGHIADLPSKEIGINLENFTPKYIVSEDKKAIIKKLKSLSKKSDEVLLASDEDREGEAIAWHLKNQLKLDDDKTKRIVFHEITESAIKNAIQNPRDINYDLVNAQQARRILDRLVGYELSPILWKKIKKGLSAGRVQSVAVRLIVDRENEIRNHISEITYKVTGNFKNHLEQNFKADLDTSFKEEKEVEKFLEEISEAIFKVIEVQKRAGKKTPPPPFTTSTLQQDAARKLGFSVSKTMMIAQKLYENGYITYMRTDSVNLSKEAKKQISETIKKTFGEEYSKPRNYKTKSKGAQEAHEAIRPTKVDLKEINVDFDSKKLYNLIWKRAVASQMADAKIDRTVVKINNNKNNHLFLAKGEVIVFDGFIKLYQESKDSDESDFKGQLPQLKKNEEVIPNYIEVLQKFSKPPARYNEAALVKKMEELGIGRPSTYAPTISTIQKRGYVEKKNIEPQTRNTTKWVLENGVISKKKEKENFGNEKNKLVPTDIGIVVNDFLTKYFDHIIDYNFTAGIEEELDKIAEGLKPWKDTLQEFYKKFHPIVEDVEKNAERARGERLLGKDPKTGKNVYVKIGQYGPLVQIGESNEEEKPLFASAPKGVNLTDITLEQALEMFQFPKKIGEYNNKEVVIATGRYGPYIIYDGKFISIPKNMDPLSISLDTAIDLIKQKIAADAPIATYDGKPVYKGKGRFGPFIKWNDLFINVPKKFDFDNLSKEDIEFLIKNKIQKEKDKMIKVWDKEGISIQKGKWGRLYIVKGKKKIMLPKGTDPESISLEIAKQNLKIK
jgi:DNA topoisomerase-1